MPGLPTSYIAPEVLKEAADIAENQLKVPDGADVVGVEGQRGYRASWSETFDITNVETKPSQKGNGWVVTSLNLTVAPDLDGANPGCPVYTNILTFPEAASDKKHQYYNLHMKGLAKMANLLRAANLVAEGDGFNPSEFFDNAESALIGSRVVAVVTKFVKKNGDKDTDIGHFTPAGA